ncbi:hypothetical protein EMCRGX_G017482 [Ephydatia muelleri]|eukprot:Em0012g46a
MPAHDFDAQSDAVSLKKDLEGSDHSALIKILAHRSNVQRQDIKRKYRELHGKDLEEDVKSKIGGILKGHDFQHLVLALLDERAVYDAKCLREAMKGLGTDERTLIDILCTRTNQEIRDIVAAYRTTFSRDLEKDVVGDTSGHFKSLLVTMCKGSREEGETEDLSKARKEAHDLYEAGEKKWSTDESTFNTILGTRSYVQLRATFEEYEKVAHKDIGKSVDSEVSGDLKRGYLCIVQCVHSRASYFADRLYRSMKGLGTDDDCLIRVVVSRSEVDLAEIKDKFLLQHHKPLSKMIEEDTSGDYRKLLLEIVGP